MELDVNDLLLEAGQMALQIRFLEKRIAQLEAALVEPAQPPEQAPPPIS